MLAYWLLFLFFVTAVVMVPPRTELDRRIGALWIGFCLVAILTGLRFRVGADWRSYEYIFSEIGHRNLTDLFTRAEPAFQVTNYIVNYLGADLWLVNLICGSIFAIGLVLFARRQSDPWLALVVATPYLIVVVAMGYTRQSVAIGLIMGGLASFYRNPSPLRFAAWIVAAAMFHRSAAVVFPLVAIAVDRNRLVNFLLVALSGYALWDAFLADSMQAYVRNYVDAGYSSQGAAIRLALSAVSAIILLVAGRRLHFPDTEFAIWRNFSFASLALLAALAIVPSSTAVDRIALYVIPLQLAVLARLPILFSDWRVGRMVVVIIEALVMFVWLNFAAHSQYWVPYRFYPL